MRMLQPHSRCLHGGVQAPCCALRLEESPSNGAAAWLYTTARCNIEPACESRAYNNSEKATAVPAPHLSWDTCVTSPSSTALKLLAVSVWNRPFTLRLLATHCAGCSIFILLICGSTYKWHRSG